MGRVWLRPRPFLRGVLAGVGLVFAIQFLINRTTIADWAVGPLLLRDSSGTADAIVVLGAGVTADCVPNQNAVHRVLLAARLWRAKRAPIVVFTGGSPVGECAVAVAMSRLAIEIGVPESSMRLETASQNTHDNAERTAPLLRGIGAHRLLIVTDRLHMRRAEGVFAKLGFETARASVPVYEAHLDNVSMLRAGVREYAALAY